MTADEVKIVRRTRQLLKKARRTVPEYGRGIAPVSEDDVSRLAAASDVYITHFVFQSSDIAMLLPSYKGHWLVAINKASLSAVRAFAVRHELAHVFAGDADGLTFLHEAGHMTIAERVADLFALADMLPDGLIDNMQAALASETEAVTELRGLVGPFAADWPVDRVDDRVYLRRALARGARAS